MKKTPVTRVQKQVKLSYDVKRARKWLTQLGEVFFFLDLEADFMGVFRLLNL